MPGCARRRGRVAGRGQLQPVLPGLRCAALPPLEPAAASPSPPGICSRDPRQLPGPLNPPPGPFPSGVWGRCALEMGGGDPGARGPPGGH